MQAFCPKVADKQQQSTKPTTQASVGSTRSPDTSRGEAETKTTNAPAGNHSHSATNNEPVEGVTSSAPQTRSKTANKTDTRGKGPRDRKQRAAKESAVLEKVLSEEFRSRSNSAPSLTVVDDTQTKITQYWGKSSSESDEADDETDDDPSYATPESPDIPTDHGKQTQKRRKRRRRNTKNSNGKLL